MRRELNADVEMIHGRYGEFKVLVDGETVVDAGAMAILGVLPRGATIVKTVRERLTAGPAPGPDR